MKLPEHVTLSFLLAQFGVQQEYGLAGTALMILAGNLPDLDGLTICLGWRFYRRYHRIVGHGLPVTLLGPLLLASLGWSLSIGPLLPLWGWLQLALLAHLFTDVCFYDWPVQLLWPFSSRGLGYGLLDWNDLVPTLLLYTATAVALLWTPAAPIAAGVSLAGLLLYLAWRALRPRAESGWAAWLTGDWVERSWRPVRWLTGDFIS
jgi:hypothetical protein